MKSRFVTHGILAFVPIETNLWKSMEDLRPRVSKACRTEYASLVKPTWTDSGFVNIKGDNEGKTGWLKR